MNKGSGEDAPRRREPSELFVPHSLRPKAMNLERLKGSLQVKHLSERLLAKVHMYPYRMTPQSDTQSD